MNSSLVKCTNGAGSQGLFADRAALLLHDVSSAKGVFRHVNEIDCMANVIDFNM